jgi:hypothetical protein
LTSGDVPTTAGVTLDIEDLVLLRTSLETWGKRASKAMLKFARADGSFLKSSRSQEGSEGARPHITTTARAYVALLYADRVVDTKFGKRVPEWAAKFEHFMGSPHVTFRGGTFHELPSTDSAKFRDVPPFNNFDIAHLADFIQVAQYLRRFHEGPSSWSVGKFFDPEPVNNAPVGSDMERAAPNVEQSVDLVKAPADQTDPNDLRQAIIDALDAALKTAVPSERIDAGFNGEMCFEEDLGESRHYFATLHALRALHTLDAEPHPAIPQIVAGARSFAIEQSYYYQRGTTQRQDPVRLAFAGCIYAIYGEHVDKDLCLAIVESLAAAQQANGSWPATHPVFRKGDRPWHIASHEVALCLTWLYFQPKVPDSARPLLIDMMQKYLLNAVIPTFFRAGSLGSAKMGSALNQPLDGWQDDHTVSADTTIGWATAIVCHFLANFSKVLDDWINRSVIEKLGLELTTKGYLIDDTASEPSERWQRTPDGVTKVVWPDLPPHAWAPTATDLKTVSKAIQNNWTDPSQNATISTAVAEKLVAPVHDSPSEQPTASCCAGLMPGSPGTRKTSLVKQIAAAVQWPMVAVPASLIFERGFDLMEAQASHVFGLLNYLRGCIIFFDEFEEFFRSRGEDDTPQSRSQTEILAQHGAGSTSDGVRGSTASNEGGGKSTYASRTIAAFTTSAMLPRLQDLHDQDRCIIFLATNFEHKIDSAIQRLGRFDFKLTVEHPDGTRLLQYFSDLPENASKRLGILSLNEGDRVRALDAIKAALGKGEKWPNAAVKFAFAESVAREVVQIINKGDVPTAEALAEAVAEVLKRLTNAGGDSPPQLVYK